MLRLVAGALAALFFVAPAAAQQLTDVPCANIDNFKLGIVNAGGEVLGIKRVPYANGVLLFWRQGSGVAAAPVLPSADGTGACVAYKEIIPLGLYMPERQL